MFKWKPSWKQYKIMIYISIAILLVWQHPFNKMVIALIFLVLALDLAIRWLKQRFASLKKLLGL